MSILFYRRPSYVQRPNGPITNTECQRYVDRTTGGTRGIPEELSFENVMGNKALPPCTLRDFMDYLVYVTHDAENLQFHLWLQDYKQRFNALKPERKSLAPEWKWEEITPEEKAAQVASGQQRTIGTLRRKRTNPMMPKIDFDKSSQAAAIGLTEVVVGKAESGMSPRPHDAFSPSNMKATLDDAYSRSRSPEPTISSANISSAHSQPVLTEESTRELRDEANAQAGLKWQAFSVQPLRQEIDRVIAHYIAPGSPRELNLSGRDRADVLHALQHTTHPSAFDRVAKMVEAILRGHAHPNFVRWSICNGNKPRVFFVRTMGVSHIAFGLIIGLLLALSRASRWWRIFMWPVLFIGLTTMIAAYKGLCVILHRGHKRTLKPWEDLDSVNTGIVGANKAATVSSAASVAEIHVSVDHKKSTLDDEEATIGSASANSGPTNVPTSPTSPTGFRPNGGRPSYPPSFEAFGSRNSFGEEAWVGAYKRKPFVRKIFDHETWVQEESVRVVQDKIVRQSQAWSLLLTTVATVVFVAVPGGGFF
ncbi:regulator of G protein-like protein [Phyllosticta citribraziliensis]|uniref:Regulator of G protein-like protein n=1 Tax=Phyllosticta citribraziliensis TaxID=989973 RepID=A0ABR1M1R1_9PEZI